MTFPNPVDEFIFFGGSLSLLVAFGRLLKPNRAIKDILVAVLFIAVAIVLIQYYIVVSTSNFGLPIIGSMPMPAVKFLAGPIILFWFQFVFDQKQSFKPSDLVHLSPFFLSLTVSITQSLFCVSGEPSGVCDGLSNGRLVLDGVGQILLIVYLLYLALSNHLLKRNSDTIRNKYLSLTVVAVVLLLAAVMFSLVGSVLRSRFLSVGSLFLISLVIIYWFLVNTRFPEIEIVLSRKVREIRYVSKIAQGVDPSLIVLRMRELMEEDRIFMQEKLSLQKLATKLKIPQHQLSRIINELQGQNFNSYVNFYRIEEAKKMFLKDPESNVLEVGYSVGFNSKSSFYGAFKKRLDMTPSEFCSQIKSENRKSEQKN